MKENALFPKNSGGGGGGGRPGPLPWIRHWLGWKWITTLKIEAKLFKLFPRILKKKSICVVVV